MSTYRKDKILQCDFHLDPLLVAQGWPYEVGLRDGILVRAQDDLRLLLVDVQPTK